MNWSAWRFARKAKALERLLAHCAEPCSAGLKPCSAAQKKARQRHLAVSQNMSLTHELVKALASAIQRFTFQRRGADRWSQLGPLDRVKRSQARGGYAMSAWGHHRGILCGQ